MDAQLIYITAPSREEALKIARALVDDRLVACANIIDGATSIYRWEGAVHEEREVVLIAKTTAARVEAAIARVKAEHSYDCPCVVALPIAVGNPAFLEWIAAETA